MAAVRFPLLVALLAFVLTVPVDLAMEGQSCPPDMMCAMDGGNMSRGSGMMGNDSMMHRGRTGDRDAMQASHEGMVWSNMSEAQRARAEERAEKARLFGRFADDGSRVTGRFVTFGYDNATGSLTNYANRDVNTTFFTLVHPESWGGNVTKALHGNVFRLSSDAAREKVHDNPTALLAVRGANLTVHLDLAAGIVPAGNISSNRTLRLNSNLTNGHGHVVVVGNGTLSWSDNDTLQADLVDGGVLFLAHPQNSALAAGFHERLEALARGTLGAEINVVDGDGAAGEDAEDYGVSVVTERVGNHSLRFRASSDDHGARALIFRTDNATLPVTNASDLRVLVDGVAAPRAASALEVLFNAAPGKAFVELANGSAQVTVGVASFSDHTIELQSASTDTTPSPAPAPAPAPTPTPGATPGTPAKTPGAPEALALLAVAGCALLLRRRRAV